MTARELGLFGEAETAEYLRRKGYTLLAHSYRCRFGEIDLIARKDGMLCFVEVKLRSGLGHGLPREFVDARKQERLRRTAAWYLSEKELDCPARFDVAEVYIEGKDAPRVTRLHYIENAF
ncbi:MAG: YraN family protein [Oscillospiraceae bacterium]